MLLWQKTFKIWLGLTKKLKDFCQICKNCPILIWLHKKIIKWRLRHIQIQVLWSNLIETSRFSNVRKSFKVFNHPYPRFESFLSEKQVAPSYTSLTSLELTTLVGERRSSISFWNWALESISIFSWWNTNKKVTYA